MSPENGPVIINPYIAGSPVKDSTMFFGREDVYAWLRQHLRGAYQDNIIVLYGERRSGKTSLLYQMKAGLGDERYIPVLLDMQGMGLEGMDGFLWEVARKIVLALRGYDDIPRLDRPVRLDFESNPRHQFEDIFLAHVTAGLGQHRLLLMFDETNRLAEKVHSGQLPSDVFDYLRSLVQQVDQINFIFSLGRRIETTDKGSSQLFNLAVYRKISFLDQDFAEDLITRPVSHYFTYTLAAIDRIHKLTSGQPYYTQLLCHNLFTRWTQEKPAQLDVADVEAVLPDVMEQGTLNFQFVWQDSNPVGQAVLAALADAAPRYRGGVMRRNLDRILRKAKLYPPEGDVTSALKELFERDLINNREPYELRIELVQQWLTKFKRLEWVREELGEVAQEWDKLEQQRRAKAPSTAEKVRYWAAPVLVGLFVGLLIVTYLLIAKQQSSPALSAAVARGATEAVKLNATLAAASTELARLESENNPDVVAARATAQAAEAIAAIALAQITATAAEVELMATEQAAVGIANLVIATPVPTNTPLPADTPTPQPTPTATSASSQTATTRAGLAAPLSGTVAYPAFNGTTYDIYFGDVASGQSTRYRTEASQPAFSADGTKIAFQSWAGTSRGLVTASRVGGNEHLVTNFLEDELPTWSPNGNIILFFSRRTGDRRSQFYRVLADVEFGNNQAQLVGIEGEYPSWGSSGEIVFRGWGNTTSGLRLAPADFTAIVSVTSSGDSYAPAISPDGKRIAYMARDEGNWDIYVVNVDGSGLKRLTTSPARDGLPTWSPNGQVIAFVSNRDEDWAIRGINADGSFQQKLFEAVNSPDGIVFYDQANSTGWLEERISWAP